MQKPLGESRFGVFQDIKKVSMADAEGRVREVEGQIIN